MKFRAHETFFIRKGWLYKGLKNVTQDPCVFVSKERNPIDVLGLGSNMVKSLRYWMKATGLTEESSARGRTSSQTLTSLAQIIYKEDRYFEELGTLYLIHYMLATDVDLATSWYAFFNEFKQKEFNREDFTNYVKSSFLNMKNKEDGKNKSEVAASSIDDDFNCLVNSYVQRKKLNPTRVNPESNIECPLDELGLIDLVDKKNKIFKKTSPKSGMVDPYILYAVMVDFERRENLRKTLSNDADESTEIVPTKEIKISTLLTEKGNIGKVFNLDINALSKELDKMSKLGLVDVVRTAGLDVVKLKSDMNFNECVEEYYSKLNG